jgi:hypothetical protein
VPKYTPAAAKARRGDPPIKKSKKQAAGKKKDKDTKTTSKATAKKGHKDTARKKTKSTKTKSTKTKSTKTKSKKTKSKKTKSKANSKNPKSKDKRKKNAPDFPSAASGMRMAEFGTIWQDAHDREQCGLADPREDEAPEHSFEDDVDSQNPESDDEYDNNGESKKQRRHALCTAADNQDADNDAAAADEDDGEGDDDDAAAADSSNDEGDEYDAAAAVEGDDEGDDKGDEDDATAADEGDDDDDAAAADGSNDEGDEDDAAAADEGDDEGDDVGDDVGDDEGDAKGDDRQDPGDGDGDDDGDDGGSDDDDLDDDDGEAQVHKIVGNVWDLREEPPLCLFRLRWEGYKAKDDMHFEAKNVPGSLLQPFMASNRYENLAAYRIRMDRHAKRGRGGKRGRPISSNPSVDNAPLEVSAYEVARQRNIANRKMTMEAWQASIAASKQDLDAIQKPPRKYVKRTSGHSAGGTRMSLRHSKPPDDCA